MMTRKIFGILLGVAVCSAKVGRGDVTSDAFGTNPIGTRATVVGDASRFTYNAGPKTITAHYDSTKATAMLLFPLASAINQNRSFTFSTTFTIRSITNFDHTDPLDPLSSSGTAELSFGLLNSHTTGTDRVGGGGPGAYDIATVDYFPTRNAFGNPTLSATVVESAEAGAGYFDKVDFPFGSSSTIPDFLSSNVGISAVVSYDAATHVLTSTFTGTPLMTGGGDPNTFTSVNSLNLTSVLFDANGFKGFNFDSFGLTLWNDPFDVATTADIEFGGFTVTAVPEPGTLTVLAIGLLAIRKRR